MSPAYINDVYIRMSIETGLLFQTESSSLKSFQSNPVSFHSEPRHGHNTGLMVSSSYSYEVPALSASVIINKRRDNTGTMSNLKHLDKSCLIYILITIYVYTT